MAVDATKYSTGVAFSHREVNPGQKVNPEWQKVNPECKKVNPECEKVNPECEKGSPGKASPAPPAGGR